MWTEKSNGNASIWCEAFIAFEKYVLRAYLLCIPRTMSHRSGSRTPCHRTPCTRRSILPMRYSLSRPQKIVDLKWFGGKRERWVSGEWKRSHFAATKNDGFNGIAQRLVPSASKPFRKTIFQTEKSTLRKNVSCRKLFALNLIQCGCCCCSYFQTVLSAATLLVHKAWIKKEKTLSECGVVCACMRAADTRQRRQQQ